MVRIHDVQVLHTNPLFIRQSPHGPFNRFQTSFQRRPLPTLESWQRGLGTPNSWVTFHDETPPPALIQLDLVRGGISAQLSLWTPHGNHFLYCRQRLPDPTVRQGPVRDAPPHVYNDLRSHALVHMGGSACCCCVASPDSLAHLSTAGHGRCIKASAASTLIIHLVRLAHAQLFWSFTFTH